MARHPRVFTRLYVSMVEAGEAAGILDIVLDRVAIQIEKEMKIKRRVKGAMVYPLIVMRFAFLVLTGMLLFLVPIFVKLFEDLGGELPFLTKIVVMASDIIRGYWFIVFPVIGLAILVFLRWKKTENGRRWWDRFRVRIPMGIGAVVLKVGMARFSRTLASLVGAGVDIIQALEITGHDVGQQPDRGRGRPRSATACSRAASIAQPLDGARRSSRRWSRTWCASARRRASSRRCSARSRTSTRTRSTLDPVAHVDHRAAAS